MEKYYELAIMYRIENPTHDVEFVYGIKAKNEIEANEMGRKIIRDSSMSGHIKYIKEIPAEKFHTMC